MRFILQILADITDLSRVNFAAFDEEILNNDVHKFVNKTSILVKLVTD